MEPSVTHRFIASIDDAGDVVVISGTKISVGHRAASGADLEFLGGVENQHGEILLEQSFHAGLVWTLRLGAGAPRALIGGRELQAGGAHSFSDGDEIRLGPAAEFRVCQPDASSASVVLELIHGTEVEGARRVLLLAPGESGRARIGARRGRHLLIPGLQADIEVLRPMARNATGEATAPTDSILLRCDSGIRPSDGGPDGATEWSSALPLHGRTFLSSGVDPSRLPPFGIALRPLSG